MRIPKWQPSKATRTTLRICRAVPTTASTGITVCDLCNDMMNKPTPAAPALSIPRQRPQPALPLLPSRSSVWQRSYSPPATSPRAALAPTINRDIGDVPVSNIVYQSLQRPKLLRGGEWQLSVLNNLVAAGFVILTIITWNPRFLFGALFFGWGIQWLIRVLGRHDPQVVAQVPAL
jgi:type IV secretory pathway TrbD component